MNRLAQTTLGIAIVCVALAGIARADIATDCHANIRYAYIWSLDAHLITVFCTEDCPGKPCDTTGSGVTGGQFVTCYCDHPSNGACNAAVRSQSAANPSGVTVCLYGCDYPKDCVDQSGGDGTNDPWEWVSGGASDDIWVFGFACYCG